MENKYAEGDLRFDILKGAYKAKVQVLRDICAKADFSLYLARLEKEVHGNFDFNQIEQLEDFDDIPEMVTDPEEFKDLESVEKISFKLQNVCELDGREIAKEVAIGESQSAKSCEFNRTADREEFLGFDEAGDMLKAMQVYVKGVSVHSKSPYPCRDSFVDQ